MAKMLVPETEVPATEGKVVIPKDEMHADENFIGSIARETIDGGKLALNVAIMLISFLALVALLDMMLGWVHVSSGCTGFRARSARFWVSCLRPWRGSSACVARLRRHWEFTGYAHGAQRGHRYIGWARKSHSAAAVVHDCHVCSVRLRQPGLDRMQIAASAHWCPSGATTWRGWACAPCSRDHGESDLGGIAGFSWVRGGRGMSMRRTIQSRRSSLRR